MEQFSLEKYLENPSRKVVTRRGNPVRIICTDRKHGEDNLPIVFLEQCHNGEFLLACRKDGRSDTYDTPYDLFFADEEEPEKSLRMSKKEALQQYEYEKQLFEQWGGTSIITFKEWLEIKSIVLADEEEELTEFEKALLAAFNCVAGKAVTTISPASFQEDVDEWSKPLIDLARKGLKNNDWRQSLMSYKDAYEQGKRDALKDSPKWKEMPNGIQGNGGSNPIYLVRVSNGHYFTTPCLSWEEDSMYIELSELEKLPKE